MASAIASQVWCAVVRASIHPSGVVSRDGRVVDRSLGYGLVALDGWFGLAGWCT